MVSDCFSENSSLITSHAGQSFRLTTLSLETISIIWKWTMPGADCSSRESSSFWRVLRSEPQLLRLFRAWDSLSSQRQSNLLAIARGLVADQQAEVRKRARSKRGSA